MSDYNTHNTVSVSCNIVSVSCNIVSDQILPHLRDEGITISDLCGRIRVPCQESNVLLNYNFACLRNIFLGVNCRN